MTAEPFAIVKILAVQSFSQLYPKMSFQSYSKMTLVKYHKLFNVQYGQ